MKTTIVPFDGPPVQVRNTDRGKVLLEIQGRLVVLTLDGARDMAQALLATAKEAELEKWKA
jgi:hypothetical protein